ncbi:gamma-glutamylcyclotransferase [Ferruginivarius sediminum]|uniref:glutathione-specific gamma-glutamylcyclotransferase n=1 Tax=Ferruginivarius sediminum TaxID=2661937 RepID=A0A369TG78_9PROT|nr:gamma-glutamylcyclotransferase [Ferruginivarius sediminum]RDD61906.1 gamma-glutamylcyclotransferase [Ferruginivarius sediminum]
MSQTARYDHGKPRLDPPPGKDFWVFGYGSLIWRPGFPHVEVRTGMLRGYHRRFCVYSHRYRGTPECPGLVLGLARGGSCRGLVYRVPAAEGEAVMDYLYEREMILGVYDPRWLKVDTDEGRVAAAGFVVDTAHHQYAGRLSMPELSRLILQGRGKGGTCLEYLRNTVHHLEALDMHDRALHRLLAYVEAGKADAAE